MRLDIHTGLHNGTFLHADMPASREISHNTLTETVAFQEIIGTDAFSLGAGRVCVTFGAFRRALTCF